MTEFKKMSSPPQGDADAEPPFLEVWGLCVLIFFHVVLANIFELVPVSTIYLLSVSPAGATKYQLSAAAAAVQQCRPSLRETMGCVHAHESLYANSRFSIQYDDQSHASVPGIIYVSSFMCCFFPGTPSAVRAENLGANGHLRVLHD